MTDGPIIMPHPDDPPPGSTPPQPRAEPTPDTDAVFAGIPARIEAAPGDVSTEHDGFGHWAMGTGGLASLLMLYQYTLGGMPLLIPAVVAFAAIYFGVRGLGAARRGFASNRWMSILGIASALLALASIVVYFLVIVAFVATVIDGGASTV